MSTWMQTFTGLVFDPIAPTVDMIVIEDIAHALSNLCRFAGHTRWHYSVAEHSERASRAILDPFVVSRWEGRESLPLPDGITSEAMARAALLHDAAEAYLVDIPSPIKRHLTGYKELEARVEGVICERFGVPVALLHHPLVKYIDQVMLATEKRDLFLPPRRSWEQLPDPHRHVILPRAAFSAKTAFLSRFRDLFP